MYFIEPIVLIAEKIKETICLCYLQERVGCMPTATGATKNGKSQVKELSQTIIRQLEDRGIDSEMAVKFGLGLIKGHGGSEKLALPFQVKNETLSWKVRSGASSNDGMFWIGQEDVRGKSFFNEDCLRDDSL